MTGAVTETSFNPTAKFEEAFVERKDAEYSYNDGDLYYFMDQETYDMIPLNKDAAGRCASTSSRRTPCASSLSYKGNVVRRGSAPTSWIWRSPRPSPAVRGNTATNVP